MHKELASVAATIANYLGQYSKTDKINIQSLQRIIEDNIKRSVPEKFIIDYLKEKGYRNYTLNEEKKAETKKPSETIIPVKPVIVVDDDDDDFDPNQFLEDNKEKILNVALPTNNFGDNIWLIEKYQSTKSDEFLSQIVSLNQGLVEKVAGKYQNTSRHKLDFDDLVSIGKFGLLKAIDRFDPKMGYQFSTYATYWIRQKITRAICDEGTTVRIPVHMHDKIKKLIRLENECFWEKSYLDVEWVCEQMDITEEQYYELKQVDEKFIGMKSLHSIVSQEDEDSLLIDFIEYSPDHVLGEISIDLRDPYENMVSTNLRNQLEVVLDELKERECEVIKHRVGFDGGKPKTLEEIGQIYGLTRERIRQIETKAINRLRAKFRKLKIKYEDVTLEA
ncbi:sigma-70 family RNA polymerase sigma factor [Mesobacillus selenatarsenatis]|uniref:RNA polymerase sigma factor n=1 Tax=Mesobacillus selenatarsenatis TaxID=388741 RepID=A0A846T570_9BACI|nr:sigma-70 family RNA polymerase sigma factor [Mesobacillus selenatarsenatis]NKE03998.1 sigma-70 family RNA polymerase sigma factor [Mesobacillus selenatarsenatis]